MTLTFDLLRSSGVKRFYAIRKPIYDSLFTTTFLCSLNPIHLTSIPRPYTVISLLPSHHCSSQTSQYLSVSSCFPIWLLWTHQLSISYRYRDIWLRVFRVWPWPLTSKGHLGSKFVIPFESQYMTSYLTSLDTISLSRTVFEILDFKVCRVWPWPLTSEGHLG